MLSLVAANLVDSPNFQPIPQISSYRRRHPFFSSPDQRSVQSIVQSLLQMCLFTQSASCTENRLQMFTFKATVWQFDCKVTAFVWYTAFVWSVYRMKLCAGKKNKQNEMKNKWLNFSYFLKEKKEITMEVGLNYQMKKNSHRVVFSLFTYGDSNRQQIISSGKKQHWNAMGMPLEFDSDSICWFVCHVCFTAMTLEVH